MKIKQIENILLFLVILLIPTQLGKHFWPPFSYIYSLAIDYLSPTIYFWDLLVVCLWVTFLLQKKNINRLALNLFYFFILTQVLSLFNSNIGAGLVRLEQYVIAGLLGVYIASQNFLNLKKVLFWPLTIGILGESILAIAQFVKSGSLFFWILGERTFSISTPAIAKFDFYGRQFLRSYATFPHPNVLAAFMVTVWPLLSLLRPKTGGMLMVWSSILAGVTIILTVSRAALLAGFLEAALLLRKKALIWLAVVLIVVSPLIYIRFSAVFNFDNLSLIRREQLNEVAFNMFLFSPIFGVGLNNFIPAASDKLLAGPSRFLQPVHNIFLLTLSETGLIGVIGLISLIGVPVYKLLKLYPKPYPLHPLLLVWAVIIFLGLFDHYFLTLPQGYRLLFLIWGLSISMVKY